MLIFLVVYTAYAQAFFMAFGMDVEAFSSYSNSFSQLFLIILGEFDFDAMKDANPDMAPLLFFSFVIFVFFILVNMFIAILGEAQAAAREAQAEAKEQGTFGNEYGVFGGAARQKRCLGSTLARLLCLLRASLAGLGGPRHPG